MLAEDTSYTPLSSEPIDLAQRLRGYIEGLVCSADRDKEDPPWLVEQAKTNYTHLPEHEAIETHRKKMRLRPHMQRRLIKATLNHVLRLEYHLRCFILFLTAQIIELGRAVEPPEPRAPGEPRGLTYAQRQDQEMRENQRELPRLNAFKVLTPVIEGEGKRKRPRRSRPYHMLPDDLKVIDAGHVFARLKRLEYVLANADKFAMSLACRAVMAVPQLAPPPPLAGEVASRSGMTEGGSSCSLPTPRHGSQNKSGIGGESGNYPLIPAQAGTSFDLAHPDSRFRGNERVDFSDGGLPQIPVQTGIHTSEMTSGSLSDLRHGHPPSRVSAEIPNPIKHPLYFAPLANFCPPAEHYDSAPAPEQKRDFNLIHWLASSRLEQIGLGVRPDPYRGLPDLSCVDPPQPPQIRSL